MSANDPKNIAEFIQSVLTSAAILVSGLWAYFHYFKGRTYRPRLEPTIACRLIPRDRGVHLLLTARLRNVGLSRVDIQQRGTAVELYATEDGPAGGDPRTVEWDLLATFPVFEDHRWIEPAETIDDVRLVGVPGVDHLAFMVAIRLVAKKISWRTVTIVDRSLPSTPSLKGDEP